MSFARSASAQFRQAFCSIIPDPDRPASARWLDSNKSFAPFINPHIQHVWGFTVDQTLTPTQSLHYCQWRNSFTTTASTSSPLVSLPNPLNSQKFEPALGSVFLLNYTNTLQPSPGDDRRLWLDRRNQQPVQPHQV